MWREKWREHRRHEQNQQDTSGDNGDRRVAESMGQVAVPAACQPFRHQRLIRSRGSTA